MWQALGSITDFVHALAMVAWIVGLPLLFAGRWPRASRAYAVYAIVFIVLSQGSHWLLGECFLTTVARWFWEHPSAGPAPDTGDWFTVRLAKAVFDMSPSHRFIVILSEALIVLTAAGVLFSWLPKARLRQWCAEGAARLSLRGSAPDPREDGPVG
jgi:hypothetical protein